MPLEIARTMMSALWELITVMLWDQNTFAGIFRHDKTKSILSRLSNEFASKGSFRCEKKRCNAGEILDEEGYCIRLECGTGFEPGPSGSCIVSVKTKKMP